MQLAPSATTVAGDALDQRHLPLGVSKPSVSPQRYGTVGVVIDPEGARGRDLEAAEPARHRRLGPASVRVPADPVTFRGVLADNFREVLFIAGSVLLALAWGGWAVWAGDSLAVRASGVAAVAAGLLLLASYVFRFRRSTLESAAWQTTRTRRVLRLVLVYAWGVYFSVAAVVGVGLMLARWWS